MFVFLQKSPTCVLCGIQGHIQRDCPGRPCPHCGLTSHGLNPCRVPPVWKQHCQRCGAMGHLTDVSLWLLVSKQPSGFIRQVLTSQEGSFVKPWSAQSLFPSEENFFSFLYVPQACPDTWRQYHLTVSWVFLAHFLHCKTWPGSKPRFCIFALAAMADFQSDFWNRKTWSSIQTRLLGLIF